MRTVQKAACLLICFITAPNVLSCTCGTPPHEVAFADSDAVFVGRPLEKWIKTIERSGMSFAYYYLEVTFRVETAWKGMDENVAVVLMPLGSGPCGYGVQQFDPETRYLIYASRAPHYSIDSSVPPAALSVERQTFWTAICRRNAVLEGPLLNGGRTVDLNSPETGKKDMESMGAGAQPSPSGDVNRDGKLSLPDVQLALRATMGLVLLAASQTIAGDMNKDDHLDMTDVIPLLRKAAGL